MMDYVPALLGGGGGALSSLASGLKLDNIIQIGIRVALIGLLTAFVRSGFTRLKHRIWWYTFPTAHVSHKDPAFEWITSFMAQSEEIQSQMKSFKLTTADARESKRDDANRLRTPPSKKSLLALGRTDATFATDEVVGQMAPVEGQVLTLKHNGNTLWIMCSRMYFGSIDYEDKDKLMHYQVSGLFYQPDSIKDFLISCHSSFFKRADNEIMIFNLSPYAGTWYDPIHRPARSWSSVILPESTKGPLLEDVRNFLSDDEKVWYEKRGIPHRRGYLLHGRPGSGKTTLATAIASQLNLDIYIVNPAARGMDDGKLNKAFRNCPPQNMILIEDIDCVMPPRPRRKGGSGENDSDDDDENTGSGDKEGTDPGKYGLAKSTVTLSGLLNAIDGVSSQEDCILFATTNHPERLDSALSRPGRFDVQLSFTDATYSQAVDLFKHFFPLSEFNRVLSSSGSSLTSSVAADGAPAAVGLEAAVTQIDEKEEIRSHANAQSNGDGETQIQPELRDEQDLEDLAKNFADGIFNVSPALPIDSDGKVQIEEVKKQDHEMEFEFGLSMAALQGFLLTYKKKPRMAASKASEWSMGLRMEQQEKERAKLARRARREESKAQAQAQAQGQGQAQDQGNSATTTAGAPLPLTPITPSNLRATSGSGSAPTADLPQVQDQTMKL